MKTLTQTELEAIESFVKLANTFEESPTGYWLIDLGIYCNTTADHDAEPASDEEMALIRDGERITRMEGVHEKTQTLVQGVKVISNYYRNDNTTTNLHPGTIEEALKDCVESAVDNLQWYNFDDMQEAATRHGWPWVKPA